MRCKRDSQSLDYVFVGSQMLLTHLEKRLSFHESQSEKLLKGNKIVDHTLFRQEPK